MERYEYQMERKTIYCDILSGGDCESCFLPVNKDLERCICPNCKWAKLKEGCVKSKK